MFLDLVNCLCTNMVIQVLETVTKEQEKNREKSWLCATNTSSVWVHRTVSDVPCWSEVNWPLSGLDDGVRLKITGPSGGAPDCSVSHPRRTRRPREKQRGDVAIIHRTVRWFTGLSGEPTVASANGRPRNPRATRASSNGRKGAPDCLLCTGLSVVHRTVRCAPDCPLCTGQCPVRQWARSCNGHLCLFWKAITHQTGYSSCPVVRCATR
jgi:hypothetical protein